MQQIRPKASKVKRSGHASNLRIDPFTTAGISTVAAITGLQPGSPLA